MLWQQSAKTTVSVQLSRVLLVLDGLCRCLDLQGLNDQQVKECVKAASFKLEYPGTLKPEAALAAAAVTAAKTAAGVAADTAKAATGTAADTIQQINGAAAAANDLAALHAQHVHSRYEELQEQLGRRMSGPSGGWSFVEQAGVVAVVVGVMWFGFSRTQRYRKAQAKQHAGRKD